VPCHFRRLDDPRRYPGNTTDPRRVYRKADGSEFDKTVLPHLDAAFNYPAWLTKNDAEAEDVVEDACVRSMRYFPMRRDSDARAWLFTIVRNTWYSQLSRFATVCPT
jgi:DNA-directed RNA polymerase specialized sigma24 family protein